MAHEYSLEELSQYFHLPINDVARELGVCATVLKKICRRNGIDRWPHRKVKSLDRMIESMEMIVPENDTEAQELADEIAGLKQKRAFLLKNPNVSYKSIVSKYCISNCNLRLQKAQANGNLSNKKNTNISMDHNNSQNFFEVPNVDPVQEENAVSVLLRLTMDVDADPDSDKSMKSAIRQSMKKRALSESSEAVSCINSMPSMLVKRKRMADDRAVPSAVPTASQGKRVKFVDVNDEKILDTSDQQAQSSSVPSLSPVLKPKLPPLEINMNPLSANSSSHVPFFSTEPSVAGSDHSLPVMVSDLGSNQVIRNPYRHILPTGSRKFSCV